MFNLDNEKITMKCPSCKFANRVFVRQVRLEETVICGGCKASINLIDDKKSFQKSQKEVNEAMEKLKKSLGKITIKF